MTYKSGTLGVNTPSASVNTTLYTVPANTTASVSVIVCNRNPQAVQVNVGVQPSGSGTVYQSLYQEPLSPAGDSGNRVEMRAIVLSPGDSLIVLATSGSVDFIASGYEGAYDANALDI